MGRQGGTVGDSSARKSYATSGCSLAAPSATTRPTRHAASCSPGTASRALVDQGSFVEDGLFANALADGLPADGVVTGSARSTAGRCA